MKFTKIIKSYNSEEWDGIEPYDKRKESAAKLKSEIEKLMADLQKLEDNPYHWQKEEKFNNLFADLAFEVGEVNRQLGQILRPEFGPRIK